MCIYMTSCTKCIPHIPLSLQVLPVPSSLLLSRLPLQCLSLPPTSWWPTLLVSRRVEWRGTALPSIHTLEGTWWDYGVYANGSWEWCWHTCVRICVYDVWRIWRWPTVALQRRRQHPTTQSEEGQRTWGGWLFRFNDHVSDERAGRVTEGERTLGCGYDFIPHSAL